MTKYAVQIVFGACFVYLLWEKHFGETTSQNESVVVERTTSVHESYHTNGRFISDSLSVFTEDGSMVSLKNEALKNKSQLLFVYDIKDCDVCFYRELENSNKLASEIGQDKVSAIIVANNKKYLKIFKRSNKVTYNMYQDRTGEVVKALKFFKTPVLLEVTGDGRINNTFYPVLTDPELSHTFYDYFRHIN